MKKISLLILILIIGVSYSYSQISPIEAERMAYFTVPDTGDVPDSLLPYYGDLGVRRVIVADADGDGDQEIIATDYTNGGRVHVMEVVQDSLLEIVWSSPAYTHNAGSRSTPRYPRVGDCDGDGIREIIFEQERFPNFDETIGRIAIFEWNGTDWGSEPAFSITPSMIEAAGGREEMRNWREYLTVEDLDGDGKDEIIPHGESPRKDVLILGINFEYPGFASIYIEGGQPGVQTNGGDWGAGGSFWNSIPADINGDGDLELINHTWNFYGFWSIDIAGPDSYVYPEAIDNADAKAKGVYREYVPSVDAVSLFGVQAVDVNGDGKDEIVGTQWGNSSTISMHSFPNTEDELYIWTEASQTENYAELWTSSDLATLVGKEVTGFIPIVGGDLNKDGKDEMYVGGGTGMNLVAIQYKGEGELLDPTSYDVNLVDDGEGGEVFAEWNIYNGEATFTYDTTFVNDTTIVIDTTTTFDPSIIDTVRRERPFTAYVWADSVDLDNDGNLEVVLSEQSVYDSLDVNIFNWIDTVQGAAGRWELDLEASYKVFNPYRRTIKVLEYTGEVTGFTENLYGIITPDDYKLEQNYPNPFNPSTTINFSLPIDKKITLKIFDMVGQEVKTLISDNAFKKGSHQIVWDGTNNFGNRVASGNYIARLTFGNFSKSIKMTVLK